MIAFRTIAYDEDRKRIIILDQTRLPEQETYTELETVEDVYNAIKKMQVRGAPLIGVVAAYGVVLAARSGDSRTVEDACQRLQSTRPTAVNLFWALKRMRHRLAHAMDIYAELLQEARTIESEDKAACQAIGTLGAGLVKNKSKIMVHCNAGALATSGIGTALGIIYVAKQHGKDFVVYSSETRPLLQGARLTTWELTKNEIETYMICDNMVATFMPQMDLVIVGADRITTNGDVANKIGTKGLAIIAHYYSVPFYVAAPTSTFDFSIDSGDQIPIEERDENEVRRFYEKCIVAPSAKICNPAFDVTPAALVTGIVTEKCIVSPPYGPNIKQLE